MGEWESSISAAAIFRLFCLLNSILWVNLCTEFMKLSIFMFNFIQIFWQPFMAPWFFTEPAESAKLQNCIQLNLRNVWLACTPPLKKRDGHQGGSDQAHYFLVLLGVLCSSRLMAPLRPSNFFQPFSTGGTTWKSMMSSYDYKGKFSGGTQRCHLSRSTQDN